MAGIEFNRNQRLVLLALIGISAIGLSITHARNKMGPTDDVVIREPSGRGDAAIEAVDSDTMPGDRKPGSTGKVIFQVAGCVKAPGVYALDSGKRVVDAVRTAGGAKPNADLDSLNLAAKIQDGSRIYVPPKGAIRAMPTAGVPIRISSGSPTSASRRWSSQSSSSSSSDKLSTPGEGVVSINVADSTELQRLPGVGPSTAEKIIEYRGRIGRFTSAEQLMDVKGIGPKKLEKMRPFVGL